MAHAQPNLVYILADDMGYGDLSCLLTDYVRHGRSTPGVPQQNFGGTDWEELWWMR